MAYRKGRPDVSKWRPEDPKPRVDRRDAVVYTDGACSPNPGAGGCAAMLVVGESSIVLTAGARKTTNNRMEIMAVILAVEALTIPCAVQIYSDSKYVVESIACNKIWYWRMHDWKDYRDEAVANPDLWDRLCTAIYEGRHIVKIEWIKGHAEDGEHKEFNDAVDRYAVEARKTKGATEIDEGYETPVTVTFNDNEEVQGFILDFD